LKKEYIEFSIWQCRLKAEREGGGERQ